MTTVILTLAAVAALLLWRARQAARILTAIAEAADAFERALARPAFSVKTITPVYAPPEPDLTDEIAALEGLGMSKREAGARARAVGKQATLAAFIAKATWRAA